VRILLLCLLLFGCKIFKGKEGDSKSSDDLAGTPTGVAIFATEKDLPKCDDKTAKAVAYVKDQKQFLTCEKGKWTVMVVAGEPGEQGEPGERGPPGVVDSTIAGTWQSIFRDNVQSVVFIESRYAGADCTQYESGTGFVVGTNLVATNGHVAAESIEAVCGEAQLNRLRIWFPLSNAGDTTHTVKGADASVTKVDRSVANSDDLVLLQVATGTHQALKVSALDEAADHLSGPGVKLSDEIMLIGYTSGTTFAHLAPGKINAIQPVGPAFLNSLVTKGIISPGKLVYQYDLVAGGGASGSPVFALNGEVVGINFAGNTADADTDYGFGLQVKPLRLLLQATRNWEDL